MLPGLAHPTSLLAGALALDNRHPACGLAPAQNAKSRLSQTARWASRALPPRCFMRAASRGPHWARYVPRRDDGRSTVPVHNHYMNLTSQVACSIFRAARPALFVAALLVVTGCAAGAPVCVLEQVNITALGAGVYTGGNARLELRLRDDRADLAVQLFPDSEIEFRRAGATVCIAPGGVWSRRAFFMSRDGATVVALESSGSSDALVFFDSANCRRVGTLDVSNGTWSITGSDITLRPTEPGRPVMRHALNASCRPPLRR